MNNQPIFVYCLSYLWLCAALGRDPNGEIYYGHQPISRGSHISGSRLRDCRRCLSGSPGADQVYTSFSRIKRLRSWQSIRAHEPYYIQYILHFIRIIKRNYSMDKKCVGVIGGGIVGTSIGYRLSLHTDIEVSLLEKDQ